MTVSVEILLCNQKHLVTTGGVGTYCHGNSAQKFGASTPIVTTSNQILGKAFSAALLYSEVQCGYIWVDECVNVQCQLVDCVCVLVVFVRIGSQKVTHHATPGV